MSDDVGRCIALQSVPFFASGEQCQVEFCLHFRVGMLDLLLAFHRLLFGGKALPFVAALAVFIFVGVSDAVRIAALRYRHPPLVLWVYGGYQNDNSHFRTIKRCDCLVDGQNDHQPESVRYS